MRKVSIAIPSKDSDGNINGSDEVSGVTEDGGHTCTIPIGYLPQLSTTMGGDIRLTLYNPLEVLYPVFVSTQDNGEEQLVFFDIL